MYSTEANACARVRLVIHREENAGDDLQHEHESGQRAEVIPEIEILWRDVLAPLLLPQLHQRKAGIDPRQHAVERAGAGDGLFFHSGHGHAPLLSSPMIIFVSPTNLYGGTVRFTGAGTPL